MNHERPPSEPPSEPEDEVLPVRQLELGKEGGYFTNKHIKSLLARAGRYGFVQTTENAEMGVKAEVLIMYDGEGQGMVVMNDRVNRRAEGNRIVPPRLAAMCRIENEHNVTELQTVYNYGNGRYEVTYGTTDEEDSVTYTSDLDRADALLARADAILTAAINSSLNQDDMNVVRLDEWRQPPKE